MDILTKPSNKYNLNKGQKLAAEAFLNFLFSSEKEFIISGPAGVGKTYLMNYIIDNTMPRYHEMCDIMGLKPEYDGVEMTATTNKAADVLSQSVGRPASTVHSFFNLTVKNDFKTGATSLQKTSRWSVHENKIIFVDEASMIDTPLWKALHEGTKNCKLVYVGDHNQLAPVQETISPVYRHETPFVELKEPVRNAGQPVLMAVCEQLRETVSSGVFKPIQIIPGVIDYLDPSEMQNKVDQTFLNQSHDSRILAFTNKRVIEYNDHIRSVRNLPEEYQVGELLINNTPVTHKNALIPVEMQMEVLNNYGADTILLDRKQDVHLDVNYLDLRGSFGETFFRVPIATNRQHYSDLMKYYSKKADWEKYFNLKNNIADLRPRDAATVHKSQGSTYDSVFVDLGNISQCNITNQVARMLYVAFSRAKSRVFLYGKLADKYGGLILP